MHNEQASSSEVSRCAEALDEELATWRERPLGAYPYVVLDARYEKMRPTVARWSIARCYWAWVSISKASARC